MTNKENRKLFWDKYKKFQSHQDLWVYSDLTDRIMFGPNIKDASIEKRILDVIWDNSKIEDLNDNDFHKLKEEVLIDISEMIKCNDKILNSQLKFLNRQKDTLKSLIFFKKQQWGEYRFYLEEIITNVNKQNHSFKDKHVYLNYIINNSNSDNVTFRYTIGLDNKKKHGIWEFDITIYPASGQLNVEHNGYNMRVSGPYYNVFKEKTDIINRINEAITAYISHNKIGGQK